MIDAKELRIGNWVLDSHSNYVKWDVTCFEMGGDRFDPIPLTPEILEKAGFVSNGSYAEHRNLSIQIVPTQSGGSWWLVPNSNYTLELKHVHQLQNLYFALTGEELEINL